MNTTDKTSFDNIATIGSTIGKETRDQLHQAIDRAADQAQPTADRLASSAHSSVDLVSDTVNDVTGTLAERSKQFGVACERMTENGREYVRGNPAVSLLVAAVAGYGLSKLIGTRSSR